MKESNLENWILNTKRISRKDAATIIYGEIGKYHYIGRDSNAKEFITLNDIDKFMNRGYGYLSTTLNSPMSEHMKITTFNKIMDAIREYAYINMYAKE